MDQKEIPAMILQPRCTVWVAVEVYQRPDPEAAFRQTDLRQFVTSPQAGPTGIR